jgi:hypothetical protein
MARGSNSHDAGPLEPLELAKGSAKGNDGTGPAGK